MKYRIKIKVFSLSVNQACLNFAKDLKMVWIINRDCEIEGGDCRFKDDRNSSELACFDAIWFDVAARSFRWLRFGGQRRRTIPSEPRLHRGLWTVNQPLLDLRFEIAWLCRSISSQWFLDFDIITLKLHHQLIELWLLCINYCTMKFFILCHCEMIP